MAQEAYLFSRFVPFISDVPDSALAKPARRGSWVRLLDAVMVSRQHQAERKIAPFLKLLGGKFTDDTDRQISERLR